MAEKQPLRNDLSILDLWILLSKLLLYRVLCQHNRSPVVYTKVEQEWVQQSAAENTVYVIDTIRISSLYNNIINV